MNRILGTGLLGVSLLTGCASFDGYSLVAGRSTAAETEALMGAPVARVTKADGGRVLYFSRQPAGRQNFAVSIAADGTVSGVEQTLTFANISKITEGKSDAAQVRDLLGPPDPDMVSRLPRQMRNVWEYLWLDNEKKRVLYVQFSDDNVVREVVSLRDDYYESPGSLP